MPNLILLLLHFSFHANAILPLPYPTEITMEEAENEAQFVRNPKEIEAYNELYSHSLKKEMELPTFEEQVEALGYEPNNTFIVPDELKSRVDFWKKIYSQYTSSQALLHDPENPEIIYGLVNVEKFTKDDSRTYRSRVRAMNRFLKEEKEKIADQLRRLHVIQNETTAIPSDLLSLYKKFENVKEENRFLEASHRIRAQLGQRDRVVQGFLFGGRYFQRMMQIFKDKGIPQELTRLPLIESTFDLSARSRVGASGVWQFMKSTGKMFLRIDRFIDERNDPISATYAAAELLRQNYEALGSWPLAVTAWNHGREGMLRASRLLATNSLPEIIKRYKSRSFGFASSNFYCEFLAMLEVEREYRKYFGKLMVDSPMNYHEVTVVENISFRDVAKECGIGVTELRSYNPGLTDRCISEKNVIPKGIRLRLPADKIKDCLTSKKLLSAALYKSPKIAHNRYS
jgi:membrane-bound lytic murein transglycosylase D